MLRVVNKRSYQGAGVYIGRPSILGNPFTHRQGTKASTIVESREKAIEAYQEWLRERYREGGKVRDELERLVDLYLMHGALVLVCWCAPQPCHGDVIADALRKLANQRRESSRT
jgi:hypothetical protein